MPAGYTRQSAGSIIDGAPITAASHNAEYNAIEAAMSAATGHNHDGTAGGGARVTAIGPAGEAVGASTGLNPKTGATYDLGVTGTRWRHAYLSGNLDVTGTALVGAASADGHAVNRVTADARYLQLANTQTVTGAKTFSANVIVPTATLGTHALNRDAADARYQQLGSSASFSGAVTVGNASADGHAMNRITSDGRYLQLAGTQTVSGTTTFGNNVTVPNASAGGHAVNRTTGDARYLQLSGGTLTGTLTGTAITLSGTLTGTQFNLDSTFFARLESSNPVLQFDTNDKVWYNRSSNVMEFQVGGTTRHAIWASAASFSVPLELTAPTADNHAARKQDVDAARVISTATVGGSGVAATIDIPATGTIFELTVFGAGLFGADATRSVSLFVSTDGTSYPSSPGSYAYETDVGFATTTAAAMTASASNIQIAGVVGVPTTPWTARILIFVGSATSYTFIQSQAGYAYDASNFGIRQTWGRNAVMARPLKVRLIDSLGSGLAAGTFLSLRKLG